MCIIIAKTKTQKAPTTDILKTCFNYNDDGAGFMYVDNNKVVIDKGYMTQASFINRYKYLLKKYNNFNNKNLIIHCRISTSGQVTKEYCHPYPITADVKKMKYTKSKCNIAIAHNGVLSNYTPKNKNMNDTMLFIKKYIFKKYQQKDLFSKDTKKEIEKTGSKFAILTNKDKLYLYGDFIKDTNYFSNETYKSYTYNTYNNYYNEWIQLDDFKSIIIDGYYVSACDIKTKEKSILLYNWYLMELYEIYKNKIINVYHDIDIELQGR